MPNRSLAFKAQKSGAYLQTKNSDIQGPSLPPTLQRGMVAPEPKWLATRSHVADMASDSWCLKDPATDEKNLLTG